MSTIKRCRCLYKNQISMTISSFSQFCSRASNKNEEIQEPFALLEALNKLSKSLSTFELSILRLSYPRSSFITF